MLAEKAVQGQQLGIILSHSEGRPWDAGGTRDDDLFAFVRVVERADGPHTNAPAYFRTAAIRAMRAHAKESGRKAISEGSEVTLTWTTTGLPGCYMGHRASDQRRRRD